MINLEQINNQNVLSLMLYFYAVQMRAIKSTVYFQFEINTDPLSACSVNFVSFRKNN